MKSIIGFFIIVFIFISPRLTSAQSEVNDCINYFNAGNYGIAISVCEKAVRLYPKNLEAHLCLGKSYYQVGELDKALKNMKDAERLVVRKDVLAAIYYNIGLIYDRKGELDNALFNYNKYLSLSRELKNKRGEAVALNNIAVIYDKKGMLDKALKYYELSLKLEYDEKGKNPIYNNIAAIYSKKGNHKKAVDYFKKAIEIGERVEDYHGVAITMLNLGDTYRIMKNYDKALDMLNDGLKKIQKVGDKFWEAVAYEYLGLLYMDRGNKGFAKEYFTKAYTLYNSVGAKANAENIILYLSSNKL